MNLVSVWHRPGMQPAMSWCTNLYISFIYVHFGGSQSWAIYKCPNMVHASMPEMRFTNFLHLYWNVCGVYNIRTPPNTRSYNLENFD